MPEVAVTKPHPVSLKSGAHLMKEPISFKLKLSSHPRIKDTYYLKLFHKYEPELHIWKYKTFHDREATQICKVVRFPIAQFITVRDYRNEGVKNLKTQHNLHLKAAYARSEKNDLSSLSKDELPNADSKNDIPNKSSNDDSNAKSAKKNKCQICQVSLSNEQALLYHLRLVHGESSGEADLIFPSVPKPKEVFNSKSSKDESAKSSAPLREFFPYNSSGSSKPSFQVSQKQASKDELSKAESENDSGNKSSNDDKNANFAKSNDKENFETDNSFNCHVCGRSFMSDDIFKDHFCTVDFSRETSDKTFLILRAKTPSDEHFLKCRVLSDNEKIYQCGCEKFDGHLDELKTHIFLAHNGKKNKK